MQEYIRHWATLVNESEIIHEDIDDGTIIGTFTIDDVVSEMGEIGTMNSKGLYYVYIRSKEGMTPHFHVFDREGRSRDEGETKGFHTCVEIRNNAYFKHGPYTDDLNKKQRDALQAFMGEIRTEDKYSSDIGMTNFGHTIAQWNDNNAPIRTMQNWVNPNTTSQPDYTTITE